MKTLGLIINPIAGMGGSVGLKGTDNCVEEALRRGAVPRANDRAFIALEQLLEIKDQIVIYTYPGAMGGDLAVRMGFSCVLLSEEDQGDLNGEESTEQDTIRLGKALKEKHVDLILFAGGDGTARAVYKAVDLDTAALGIPAGVKIHSPVYAKNPKSAGSLACRYLTGKVAKTKEEEVLDIDEELYRQEIINTRLYGYLKVPMEKSFTQNRKAPSPVSEIAAIESIAYQVVDNMEKDIFYLIGAGTTTRGVMMKMGLKNTLIGVDLVCNGQLVASDIYGDEILKYIKGKKTKLIVTVTGGQGFLFGRGNQQLTPEVIKEVGRENIMIIATKTKLSELHGEPLLVDTFDQELNKSLCGYYKAVSGYGEFIVCKVTDH